MKTNHIILIVVLVITVPLLSILGFSMASFYFARNQAIEEYRDVAEVLDQKAPEPMDSLNFQDAIHAELKGGGKIKLKLSLGFSQNNPELAGELSSRRNQLRNIIKLILMGKSKAELSSVEKQLKLREELKQSINHILSEGEISEVYFMEYILK